MIIEISSEKLIIKQIDSKLKPRHKSQLYHWGFLRNEDEDCLWIDNNIDIILPKVLKYFDKSEINYNITESCKQLLKEISEKTNAFQKLLETGRQFKDGNFNNAEFDEHLKFLSEHIPRKLKDHQIKASYHLLLVKHGANFSVPGAGKTTVVLSVYEKLRSEGKVNMLFVVGPPACFGPWQNEFVATLGRKPDCNILAGGNMLQRKSEYYKRVGISELYLTTFHTLLNDQEEVSTFLTNKLVKAFLVIDEAHYIKQVNGNWANAVLNIAKHSKYRCVLTGTPIPKTYSDMYNLFDFLWSENSPISANDKARLRVLEENKNYEEASRILKSTVGPLFYRVRKAELKLKPQVFNEPEVIVMNPNERKVYDAIAKKIRNYATEDYLKNIDFVEKLRRGRMIRLRQCLSFTKLLSTAIHDYEEDLIADDTDLRYVIYNYDKQEVPGKLTRLLELVKGFQDRREKVVIWAHFIGTIKLIEKHMIKAGFRCKKIIGETPIERTAISEEETREKIRNEFVDAESGLDILVANPAACAESISLHKTCHNAVYYDLSYNCAQFLQSLDRIHRVGGSENQEAYYYFLQYENTIDPDILSNLEAKAQKMYNIIDGDYNIYSLDMFEGGDELEAYERLFLKSR